MVDGWTGHHHWWLHDSTQRVKGGVHSALIWKNQNDRYWLCCFFFTPPATTRRGRELWHVYSFSFTFVTTFPKVAGREWFGFLETSDGLIFGRVGRCGRSWWKKSRNWADSSQWWSAAINCRGQKCPTYNKNSVKRVGDLRFRVLALCTGKKYQSWAPWVPTSINEAGGLPALRTYTIEN